VAENIIGQCRRAGAGNFAAIFGRAIPPEQQKTWYHDFGDGTIPYLRAAAV
jgi:hypothetical protein